MNRLKPLFAALLCLLPAAGLAQHAGRTDSTVPALNVARPGERIISTRPQRDAAEAAFRQELLRQAELDRLFNLRPYDVGMSPPVYPSILLAPGAARPPCVGGNCVRPQPLPQPLPQPQPFPQPLPMRPR